MKNNRILTEEQLETFRRDGVLVVDNVLSDSELKAARSGLHHTLLKHRVDTNHLQGTGQHLRALSSTNGSGGVLDLFYEDWKLEIAVNDKLFKITTELWATYQDESWHPYGTFNATQGFAYLDRICHRLPTELAKSLDKKPIQRSLTPHLDCCPDKLFVNHKWRPIQCFVSLSDTLQPNHGGFEAAKGFHRDFETWRMSRPLSGNGKPAPCLGEYTHIRRKEDAEVMQRIQHVPVSAGSAVFWDNRIPHANSYLHNGSVPRSVVYCSFLPDIPINREFAQRQLRNWKEGRRPNEFWIKESQQPLSESETFESNQHVFNTDLRRRLLAIQDWDKCM